MRGHAWAPEIGKGASITTFDNPQNQRFEVVTFSPPAVAHVALQGQRQAQDSFYPGYTWRLVTCAKCGAHLGWKFEPVKKKKAAATCSIEGDGQTTAHSHDHGHGHAEGGTGTDGGSAEGGEDNDEDDEEDDEEEGGTGAEEDDELDVVHIEGEGSKSDLDLGFLKGTQRRTKSHPVCVNVRARARARVCVVLCCCERGERRGAHTSNPETDVSSRSPPISFQVHVLR